MGKRTPTPDPEPVAVPTGTEVPPVDPEGFSPDTVGGMAVEIVPDPTGPASEAEDEGGPYFDVPRIMHTLAEHLKSDPWTCGWGDEKRAAFVAGFAKRFLLPVE